MRSFRSKIWILLFTLLLAVVWTSCSVVYNASISGSVLNKKSYNDNPEGNNGIQEVFVYLYFDPNKREQDITTWSNGNGVLPDHPSHGEPNYFASTHTDNNGDFSFNGLIWDSLFPKYGKSGDRRDVYFLFYHPDYGLVSNTSPTYIVSDVNNNLPPFLIIDLYHTKTIRGYVYNYDLYRHDAAGNALDTEEQKSAALQGVTVDIYVPTNWSYNSSGTIVNLQFPDTPTYSLTSDADGMFEQEITFPAKPSRENDKGTVQVALVYRANGYIAHPDIDTNLLEDLDFNQDEIHEDWEVYALSPVINGTQSDIAVMNDIDLLPSTQDIWIQGYVRDAEHPDKGVANINISIYLPTDWSYTSGTLKWKYNAENQLISPLLPNNAVNLTTDNDGYWITQLSYTRHPGTNSAGQSVADKNEGRIPVFVQYSAGNYLFSDLIDTNLTAATNLFDSTNRSADLDGDGLPDVYQLSTNLAPKQTNTLHSILTLPALQTATLKGKVLDLDTGNGVSGVTVSVYLPTNFTLDAQSNLVWEYNSVNELTNPVLSAPTAVTTDNKGEWETVISWNRLEGTNTVGARTLDKNKGITRALITYSQNGQIFSDLTDPHLTAATNLYNSSNRSLDLDGDGKSDCYLLTEPILKDQTNQTIDVLSVSSQNTAILQGYIKQMNSSNKGISNVNVQIYVPSEWHYDSATNLLWNYNNAGELTNPQFPTTPVVVTSDKDGYWEYSFSYPKTPGTTVVDQNFGLIQVAIVPQLDNYAFDSSVDSKAVAATNVFNTATKALDLDGDRKADPYYITPFILNRTNIQLPDLYLIRSEFTQDLSGRIWKDLNTNATLDSQEGENGLTVELFLNRSTTPLLSDNPDYSGSTSSKYLGDGSITEKGHFLFHNLTWSQTNYAGNQSQISCYLRVKQQTNILITNYAFTLFSDTENYLEVQH